MLHRSKELLATRPDMAELHSTLSRLPPSLPWEPLVTKAGEFFIRFPPSDLASEVKWEAEQRRLLRQKAEQQQQLKESRQKREEKKKKSQSFQTWLRHRNRIFEDPIGGRPDGGDDEDEEEEEEDQEEGGKAERDYSMMTMTELWLQ